MFAHVNRRQFLGAMAGGATAGGTGLGGYAFAGEPRFRLAITRYDLAVPGWQPDAPPLTVAVLSDIHACEPWMPAARVAWIAKHALKLQPDMILLLGDYVGGVEPFDTGDVPGPEWAAALGMLTAPLGVHAVVGNNDWAVDIEEVRRLLAEQDIPVYENDAVKIEKDGHSFWLAGLGDQAGSPKAAGQRDKLADLSGTLAQVTDNDPVILMAHEPDIFVRVPERVSLTLSGHTHGGQVRIPFFGPPIVPSDYGRRFAYGHVVEEGRHLVVTGGLGCANLPVRFMVPPEIVLITLKAAVVA